MRFIHFGSVGSTQDEARSIYKKGERGPLWIRADEQTKGRGRRDRHWVSKKGNLYTTFLFPSDAQPASAALYGFAASLAIADTLEIYRPRRDITLKWPNDVLVGGAKISGLLIERQAEALLLGIGINLVTNPRDTPYPATNLLAEMHKEDLSGPEPLYTGVEATLALLCSNVSDRFKTLSQSGFEPIRQAWLSRAHHLNKIVQVNGETGFFTDLERDGALCLMRSDGRKIFVHAGDVSFG